MSNVLFENIRIAVRSLRKNVLRTLLSITGIAIGITAIVVILSAGLSLKAVFYNQLAMFGTDYIQTEIKVPNTDHASASNAEGLAQGISITTLSLDDKKAIDALPNIRASYAAVMGQSIARTLYDEKQVSFFAATYEFPLIDTTGMAIGRFYTDEEEQSLERVIVLGSEAARLLFPNQNAIGQTVKLEKTPFKVIGVMNERGSIGFVNMDEWIYVPLRTAQKLLLGYDHLTMILSQMKDPSRDDETAQQMISLVRINHRIDDPKKDDFAVTTQKEGLEILDTIFGGITLVLTIIAAVALVVGGVGIMNIMYVSVNERTFEIGLRKAVGAQAKHVRQQFLIEALVVTILGGVAGIVLALCVVGLVYVLAQYSGFAWPFAMSRYGIVLSLSFSIVIGLIFGYFPAKRAAAFRPIEALNRKGVM